jgi:hypothetical protein
MPCGRRLFVRKAADFYLTKWLLEVANKRTNTLSNVNAAQSRLAAMQICCQSPLRPSLGRVY